MKKKQRLKIKRLQRTLHDYTQRGGRRKGAKGRLYLPVVQEGRLRLVGIQKYYVQECGESV